MSAKLLGMPTDQDRRASGASASPWIIIALGLILTGALALRLAGLGFLLPHLAEPDSNNYIALIEARDTGNPYVEPTVNMSSYPDLVPRIARLLPRAAGDVPERADLDAHLKRAAAQFLDLRLVVALFSWLIAPATWFLARRFLTAGGALAATALMSASVLYLWFAQQARPHGVSAACALLSVLASIRLRRSGRPLDWALAGLALGLAIGSLQSGLAAVLPFLAAVFLRTSEARKTSLAWILLALFLVAACVRFLYPFAFDPSYTALDTPEVVTVQGGLFKLAGHSIGLSMFNGLGFEKTFMALCNYEPWILGSSLLGGAILLARILLRRTRIEDGARADLFVVLAYALPYLVAIGLYQRTYQRFVIPLLPYLCCLSAYGITFLGQAIGAHLANLAARRALAAALAILLVGPEVYAAIRLCTVRSAPDTATRAADWIRDHLTPGADRIFVMPALELPLPETPDAIDANRELMDHPKRPWYRYQRALAPESRPIPQYALYTMPIRGEDAARASIRNEPVKYLESLNADYAVIEVYEGRRFPMLGNLRIGLQEIGELRMRASPDAQDEGCNVPLYYQDDEYPESSPWWWRVLHARSFGPIVEIYELGDRGSARGSRAKAR